MENIYTIAVSKYVDLPYDYLITYFEITNFQKFKGVMGLQFSLVPPSLHIDIAS